MMSAWENKKVLASVSPAEISQEKSPHKLLQLIPQFRQCLLFFFFFNQLSHKISTALYLHAFVKFLIHFH